MNEAKNVDFESNKLSAREFEIDHELENEFTVFLNTPLPVVSLQPLVLFSPSKNCQFQEQEITLFVSTAPVSPIENRSDVLSAQQESISPILQSQFQEPEISLAIGASPIQNTSSVNSAQQESFSPILQSRLRKRKADVNNWKRHQRQESHIRGHHYVNRNGTDIPEKEPRIMEDCKCIFNCHVKIDAAQQTKLFLDYMALKSTVERKIYLNGLITEKDPQRCRPRKNNPKKKKSKSREYYLLDAEGTRHRVCQKFFLFVFQISFKVTNDILKRRSSTGILLESSHGLTGKKPINATSAEDRREVENHIKSFPRIPSHYCRKNTKKLYLSPELNTTKLYELYSRSCDEKKVPKVSDYVYRSIFNSFEPPLSTFTPKKDQCSLCNQYKNSEEKEELEEKYREHKNREKISLKMKSEDMSANREDYKVFTFDLEAILQLPHAGDAQIFYKRKLNLFNFTIFDDEKNGQCWLWDECNGKKGCNEIATCLTKYIRSLPPHIKEVTGWCDTCAGQNRNQYLMSALIYIVNSSSNIDTINIKYLETGHTYLECDSMHSRIEFHKRHLKLYDPSEMRISIEQSRKVPKPYVVSLVNYNDFLDYKSFSTKFVMNHTIDEQGNGVQWLKIKWLRFEKGSTFVKYKYEYHGDFKKFNFQSFPTGKKARRKTPTTHIVPVLELSTLIVPKLFTEKLPISIKKYKDLIYLCDNKIIPEYYHSFYEELPRNSKTKDVFYCEDEDESSQ